MQALERNHSTISNSIDALSEMAVAKAVAPTDSVIDGKLVFEYTYTPSVRDFKRGPAGARLLGIMDERAGLYRDHLAGINELADRLGKIHTYGSPEEVEPYWENGWFESLDGASLYYFLVKNNPPVYMEVGSGNSTKFARKAIKDHGLRTKIVSIDPHPRANIDKLCDKVIRLKCEDVDRDVFATLGRDDILFVDNSHRSFQGSDVTVFFTELLPVLPKGMLFGIHDIWLPLDYPPYWVGRFYNEQYLLMSYLYGGMGGGSIELPVCHVNMNGATESAIQPELLDRMRLKGGAFWMRR
ncbi:class I SAM-dependent methyltransferase [Agrobacterium tumefaciens]|nr:class I SAM-dependent methyltransferase [Agrobacterium tumefaciens]NSZ36422.1 class I SAM-dependent methyltransferase [Agrobacterium tumefaciens]NTB24228.1 class I SAM-dependent methyltransferase [Agrobacterium tumefaciens]NTB31283.1 class I SAM-dependent methyltransferase [Agrobacterium tumefaciens]NTB35023.1 class I SAM-dependent methyltransferase [Agrobacterium tumefaciens]